MTLFEFAAFKFSGRWTVEEDAILEELGDVPVGDGPGWDQIAAKLKHRTPSAFESLIRDTHGDPISTMLHWLIGLVEHAGRNR